MTDTEPRNRLLHEALDLGMSRVAHGDTIGEWFDREATELGCALSADGLPEPQIVFVRDPLRTSWRAEWIVSIRGEYRRVRATGTSREDAAKNLLRALS